MTFRFSATAAALLTAGLLSACSLAPTASMCREATENELGRMARQTCPRGGSVIIILFADGLVSQQILHADFPQLYRG